MKKLSSRAKSTPIRIEFYGQFKFPTSNFSRRNSANDSGEMSLCIHEAANRKIFIYALFEDGVGKICVLAPARHIRKRS
jgi:hypothetical protein